LTVKVKSIVSYTAIDDISYYLHAESEVDMLKEDTQSKEIDSEDVDDDQYKTLLDIDADKENAIQLGIDVSKWNGDIDWDVVKAEGVDFAIIRCGYRGSSSGWLIEDPYFYKNIQGAKKAGIKVGIYFFTQATGLAEAVEEASAAVSLLGDIELDYPVYIDTESAGGNGRADSLDSSTRTAVVNAFCQTIIDSGLEAGIYASRNWYYNNLNVDELTGYSIWLAEYRQTPAYEGKYDMWQYTSSGSVAGIEGRVDLNVSYLGR
jgi:GH25 family lysozyme M1 (1,4-beta-N-acetylmuramidase)